VNAGCNINLRDATKISIIGSEEGENAGRSGFWRDSKHVFLDAKYRRGDYEHERIILRYSDI
jgi:hypothetical protein